VEHSLYSFGRGWRTAWHGADCKAPEYICTYNPLGDADLSKVAATLSAAAAAAPKWTMVYTGGSEVVNRGDQGTHLACLPAQNIRPSHSPSTCARPAPPRQPG
jgi:hypothetical protein